MIASFRASAYLVTNVYPSSHTRALDTGTIDALVTVFVSLTHSISPMGA